MTLSAFASVVAAAGVALALAGQDATVTEPAGAVAQNLPSRCAEGCFEILDADLLVFGPVGDRTGRFRLDEIKEILLNFDGTRLGSVRDVAEIWPAGTPVWIVTEWDSETGEQAIDLGGLPFLMKVESFPPLAQRVMSLTYLTLGREERSGLGASRAPGSGLDGSRVIASQGPPST